VIRVIDTIDRDGEGRVRYRYTLVTGHWQSLEDDPGNTDEVTWLTRAETIEQNLATARPLLPQIDLALARK